MKTLTGLFPILKLLPLLVLCLWALGVAVTTACSPATEVDQGFTEGKLDRAGPLCGYGGYHHGYGYGYGYGYPYGYCGSTYR